MKNLTVSDLRGSDYKVRVQHKRAYYVQMKSSQEDNLNR